MFFHLLCSVGYIQKQQQTTFITTTVNCHYFLNHQNDDNFNVCITQNIYGERKNVFDTSPMATHRKARKQTKITIFSGK